MTFVDAKHDTSGLKLQDLRKPVVVDLPVERVSPPDLPMDPAAPRGGQSQAYVEFAPTVEKDLDKDLIATIYTQGRMHDLPAPFGLMTRATNSNPPPSHN